MSYSEIVNPIDNQRYSIFEGIGKTVLKKYIRAYKKGGSEFRPLPQLRKISYKNKKHRYRLKDPQSKRILAIDEGVRMESKKTGKTKRDAAIAKKGRFNILRIYRKNFKSDECRKITEDMKYMDKKYGLGTTNDICGIQKGSNLERGKRFRNKKEYENWLKEKEKKEERDRNIYMEDKYGNYLFTPFLDKYEAEEARKEAEEIITNTEGPESKLPIFYDFRLHYITDRFTPKNDNKNKFKVFNIGNKEYIYHKDFNMKNNPNYLYESKNEIKISNELPEEQLIITKLNFHKDTEFTFKCTTGNSSKIVKVEYIVPNSRDSNKFLIKFIDSSTCEKKTLDDEVDSAEILYIKKGNDLKLEDFD